MAQITYADKTALNVNSDIQDTNKINASDMNEIKSVVNENYSELSQLSTNVNGMITNEYSTSTTNTYSCDYMNEMFTISTSEVKTNKKYIDENNVEYDVYRKGFNVGNFNESGRDIDTGITNFGVFIDIGGHFIRPDINSRKYTFCESLLGEYYFDTATNKLHLATNSQYITFKGFVWIEYTKSNSI